MTKHSETARALAEEALKLALALNTADEIQWERSPVPTPRDDTTQRASGGHGDPTGDIVLDPRRMAVRGATVAAGEAMKNALRALREARRDVLDTVDRWNGE